MNNHTPPPMPADPSSGANDPHYTDTSSNSPTISMAQGNGKPKVFKALGWGFKSTFAQPVWIGFTFLIGFILLLLMGGAFLIAFLPTINWISQNPDADASMMPTEVANPSFWLYYIVASLCIAVFTVVYISAALKSVNGQHITFGEFFRPRKALWTFIMVFVGSLVFMFTYDAAFSASTTQQSYGDAGITTSLAAESSIGGELFFILIITFATPLFILIPYVWQDTELSFFEGIKRGFTAGARNYLPLLGFYLLFGLITSVAVLPFGLGMIIVAPAQALATAFFYRQATGGIHPQT